MFSPLVSVSSEGLHGVGLIVVKLGMLGFVSLVDWWLKARKYVQGVRVLIGRGKEFDLRLQKR